jgi:hypothetical protein
MPQASSRENSSRLETNATTERESLDYKCMLAYRNQADGRQRVRRVVHTGVLCRYIFGIGMTLPYTSIRPNLSNDRNDGHVIDL